VKVYSNTTPFISFAAIQRLDLLPKLFGIIRVTEEVIAECAAGEPIAVPDLRGLDWIIPIIAPSQPVPHILLELDRGEKTTLLAALADSADLVLMDEKLGRNMAEYLGLRVTGTLGTLLRAKRMRLIESFVGAAAEMRARGIFFNVRLIGRLAGTVGE
jgi:predicted nucleic acid-binding protein